MASSSPPRTKADLQALPPDAFEELVAALWRAEGWDTEVTPTGPDAGIDVIATRQQPFQQKQVIQAKRYADDNPIGGPAIQQYASLLRQVPNADMVVVITTGKFTESAQRRANELNVKLVDGDSLETMVQASAMSDEVEPASSSSREATSQRVESTTAEYPGSVSIASDPTPRWRVPFQLLFGGVRFLFKGLLTVITVVAGGLLLFSAEEWIEILRILLILLVGGYVLWVVTDILVFNGALPG